MSSDLPPPSDSEQPKEEQGRSNAQNNKIESLVHALIDIEKANGEAESAERKRTHKHEVLHIRLTVFEIFLVATYAFFTILEWSTFNSEKQTMEAEFKASQTNASLQLKEMEQQRNLDERAWVSPVEQAPQLEFIPQSGASFTNDFIKVLFKNTGRTPAIDVRSWVGWRPSQIEREQQIFDITNQAFNAIMLAPGERGSCSAASPLPDSQVHEWAENERLYVYGMVVYWDIFNQPHWSEFCYRISADLKTFIAQTGFNTCDDAKRNKKP